MSTDQMHDVSVIIPTLDESDWIDGAVRSVHDSFAGTRLRVETIVVDGGSRDETTAAAKQAGADIVIESRGRGRAQQLNRGMRAATGEWFLLLHADARLTVDWAEEFDAITAGSLQRPDGAVPCGGWAQVEIFSRRTPSLLTRIGLRLIEEGINWRTRTFTTATADQAIFVRRDVAEAIGGIPEVPVLEGNRLARRLRSYSNTGRPIRIMKGPVRISARRWLRGGLVSTSLKMYAVRVADRLGIPMSWLDRWWETSSSDT